MSAGDAVTIETRLALVTFAAAAAGCVAGSLLTRAWAIRRVRVSLDALVEPHAGLGLYPAGANPRLN